jgi:hypothetical protein
LLLQRHAGEHLIAQGNPHFENSDRSGLPRSKALDLPADDTVMVATVVLLYLKQTAENVRSAFGTAA